jgi:hypothetical protein
MDQNKNPAQDGPDDRDNMGGQERGTGSQGEKNSSGISNRGIGKDDEQAGLPSRGSSDESGQSER